MAPRPGSWLIPTRVNTQPAYATYRTDRHSQTAHATGVVVLGLEGQQIATVTQFLEPDVLTWFGLPLTLTAEDERPTCARGSAAW